ncbi:uncharacterized protein LOC143211007 [Lasioglossum baleicum]|uniref:uncharacterized protein LOC143211007 n=1 Tax=Lasioglossum baleicum TaxID=434251 RepID=UPI003FCDA257
MNKHNKLSKKRGAHYGNRKTDNTEEDLAKQSMKLDAEVSSPKHASELRLSGHSTPIRRKEYIYDTEESPDLYYNCSPISQPCTQDGGNEIAWDWQVPVPKGSNDKSKPQTNLVETPKRTRQLQKKRNSNSPLLQKPLKRKQIKIENMENIGKLAAELRALTERMESIKGNSEIQTERESKLVIELDSESDKDLLMDVNADNDKSKITVANADEKDSNYKEFFDDSIEDSMVKCSQEIEEKLKINKSKGSMELSVVIEEREMDLFYTDKDLSRECLTTSINSNLKNSDTSKSSSSMAINTYSRKYSNNSSKTSLNDSISVSICSSRDSSTKKCLLNNNVINAQNGDHMLQAKDLSDFPDDSFDDCLATCMEDDKLLSKLSEYDFVVSDGNIGSNYYRKTISKRTISNTVGIKNLTSNCVPKSSTTNTILNKSNDHENSRLISNDSADYCKSASRDKTTQQSFTGNTAFENRKFFKTKSLSDQFFRQGRNSSVSNKTSKADAPSNKRFQPNSHGSSVSTSLSITKDQKLYASNNFPSNSGGEVVPLANRLEKKEAGESMVIYKSNSNLSIFKETAKSIQSSQCTPEEIERKRLEAKMKLEAKRKQQQCSMISGTQSKLPMNKSVKR